MNRDDCDIILNILNNETEPIDKNILYVRSGILETEDFNNAVSYLEKKGKIIVIKRKKIATAKVAGYITASIVRQTKKHSFAHPQDEETEDIFIHADSTKGSMPGDIVLIKNVRSSEKGLDGEVDRILEKGSRIIVGKIERTHGKAYIIPDSNFTYSLPVVKGGELKSKNGDKVKASLFFDLKKREVYARVIHIYGDSNSAKICSNAIIDANGIPSKFSVAVKHEAAMKAAELITDKEIAKRLDLHDEPIFTIDGSDAKDLDDAISVKKTNDGWELGVHIADVSHYVTDGSKLDDEAIERGTSVYFADRVIPMLPVEISNGCCSLNAGQKKLTFSAIMKLDSKAEMIDYKFVKSIIISKVRGVYSEVNKILDGTADDELKEKYDPVYKSIFEARELANILKDKAKRRGELNIETTELKFVLDENGVCIDVAARQRGEAEELIEQFMIMANQAAALYAKSADIPFIYRVHESPDPERLKSLANIASACGFKTHRLKEGVRQADLASLIDKSKETKYSRLISTQVLRTMAKARYENHPLGHFGLSLDDYCHFTSPIRRYPDTSVHRILTDLVSGVPIDKIKSKYEDFAKRSSKMSSERELRAMKAEREAEKCYAAEYMCSHIGEVHNGCVSSVTNKGIFVTIENGIEGFVNLLNIYYADFEFNGTTTIRDRISGEQYSIGDSVTVQVLSASVSSGTVDFVIHN